MTQKIHITMRDLEAIAETFSGRTQDGHPVSKSGALNLLSKAILGKGDWGRMRQLEDGDADIFSNRFLATNQDANSTLSNVEADPELPVRHIFTKPKNALPLSDERIAFMAHDIDETGQKAYIALARQAGYKINVIDFSNRAYINYRSNTEGYTKVVHDNRPDPQEGVLTVYANVQELDQDAQHALKRALVAFLTCGEGRVLITTGFARQCSFAATLRNFPAIDRHMELITPQSVKFKVGESLKAGPLFAFGSSIDTGKSTVLPHISLNLDTPFTFMRSEIGTGALMLTQRYVASELGFTLTDIRSSQLLSEEWPNLLNKNEAVPLYLKEYAEIIQKRRTVLYLGDVDTVSQKAAPGLENFLLQRLALWTRSRTITNLYGSDPSYRELHTIIHYHNEEELRLLIENHMPKFKKALAGLNT